MKHIFLTTCLSLFVLAACNQAEEPKLKEMNGKGLSNSELIRNEQTANEPTDTVNVAKMEFETPVYDFGTVDEGKKVNYTYKFKNVGKKTLVVTSARASCGCTVPEKPDEPIESGEEGEIKVTFNSEGRPGAVNKTIIITANTYPVETKVKLVGKVEPK